ncbi:polysaccharide deacetylase family protein [Parvularcula marina]|uniref:Chitooligosaccharide deacetylase n=1 Tax=Parvularcula marina TaxID=2292771 RepID=A0A371RGR9_9PROT|nr:polysaccharide deacetylase family protein [Parvularcula marina]RFB04615.1 hypothetical protein DX908_04570 [Parvularcula marina]
MKIRHLILLALTALIVAPVVACGTVQRVAVPAAEPLIPAGMMRLPAAGEDKFVVLTIDDAPSSRTQEIVDLLARYDARATFFVHTDQISEDTRLALLAAIEQGHELGSHLPADEPAWKMSEEEFSAAFAKAHTELATFGDGARLYFRPPHGIYRPRNMDTSLTAYGYDRPLAALGIQRRYVLASFIPWDAGGNKTNTDDPDLNAKRARKYAGQLARNVYPGAIVVFHDGEAGGREARLAATFISLEAFLIAMDEKGYDVISLSQGIDRISRPE